MIASDVCKLSFDSWNWFLFGSSFNFVHFREDRFISPYLLVDHIQLRFLHTIWKTFKYLAILRNWLSIFTSVDDNPSVVENHRFQLEPSSWIPTKNLLPYIQNSCQSNRKKYEISKNHNNQSPFKIFKIFFHLQKIILICNKITNNKIFVFDLWQPHLISRNFMKYI